MASVHGDSPNGSGWKRAMTARDLGQVFDQPTLFVQKDSIVVTVSRRRLVAEICRDDREGAARGPTEAWRRSYRANPTKT